MIPVKSEYKKKCGLNTVTNSLSPQSCTYTQQNSFSYFNLKFWYLLALISSQNSEDPALFYHPVAPVFLVI